MGDLAGKTVLITGATSGIGRASAFELAKLGPMLFLVARDRAKGEALIEEISSATGNRDLELLVADLASLAQVRRLADEFLAKGRPLHVLLNNAGIFNAFREESTDGFEKTFAVNHLAYFLLTQLLLDRIRESAPARIVNVASDAHGAAGGRLDMADLQTEGFYNPMRVYGKSKLANILFTRELARRLEGSNVTCSCVHPGFVGTNFARNNGRIASFAMLLFRPFIRTPEKGAETVVHLCASAEVEGRSGGYWVDCREAQPKDFARNDEDARKLWEVSEALVARPV